MNRNYYHNEGNPQNENSLETYEWDNVWWEQAPDRSKKRVMYIGDSISCGIRRNATECAGGKYLFDGFGTSKAVDNPFFKESVRVFGRQQGRRDLILFSNGLHGFHLDDRVEYVYFYEQFVQFLRDEYPGTLTALLLITEVEGQQNERVLERNKGIRKIAEKYRLPVIDLYTLSVEYRDMHCEDGVHFTETGYRKLAEELWKSVEAILDKESDKKRI